MKTKFRHRRETRDLKRAIKFAKQFGGSYKGNKEQRESFEFWYREYWSTWV